MEPASSDAGGGSCLVKNFGEYDADRVTINEDICATAKGYELLAARKLAGKKGGRKERWHRVSKVSTVTVRFYLDRDDDRRAYEYLEGRGKAEYRSLSRAIIAAVDGFFSQQERLAADPYLETREKEDTFLRRIQETIERGLQASVLGNLSALLQSGTAVTPAEGGVAEKTDEGADLDEALDFIDTL